jgi:hypothetical protein
MINFRNFSQKRENILGGNGNTFYAKTKELQVTKITRDRNNKKACIIVRNSMISSGKKEFIIGEV